MAARESGNHQSWPQHAVYAVVALFVNQSAESHACQWNAIDSATLVDSVPLRSLWAGEHVIARGSPIGREIDRDSQGIRTRIRVLHDLEALTFGTASPKEVENT
jgi:hypothetical protein